MATMPKHRLALAGGFALMGLGCSAALAGPVPVTVTWNSGGSTPALSTPGSTFSFNNATIKDFSTIYLTPTGPNTFTATESGFLPISSLSLGATPVNPAGFNGFPGSSPYQIYGSFTATSNLTLSGGVFSGSFTSLSFSLTGDQLGNASFGFDAAGNPTVITGADTQIGLATGSLACLVANPNCQNDVGIAADGTPSAHATTTFTETNPGFFVLPPASMLLDLFAGFTNQSNEVTCYGPSNVCPGGVYGGTTLTSGAPAGAVFEFEIGIAGTTLPCTGSCTALNPGGGSVDFVAAPVPEPASLLLLGSALLGFGGLGWHRRRKQEAGPACGDGLRLKMGTTRV